MFRPAVLHDAARSLAGLVMLACVSGCSHASAKPVNGPDGEPGWFAITCTKGEGYCREKVGDVCPDSYDVMDVAGHHGVATVATVDDNGGGTTAAPTFRGHMLIKCKGAPAGP